MLAETVFAFEVVEAIPFKVLQESRLAQGVQGENGV